ncbi:hypothetical protein BC629DRAFT_1589703 [Irpex lacteus]|nr:hypothetical protein BC629DRAFT_1589703 [Irpex lacteus]
MSVAVSRMPFGPGDLPRLSAGAAFAEAVGIDLNIIGKAEAKKIMSIEHKVLGFRPPQGSFAAEAQAAAAKHPEVPGVQLDSEKLKEAAKIDAQRILAERNQSSGSESPTSSTVDKAAAVLDDGTTPDVDLTTLSEADARKLMSHEHRALGFRPPPGSVAAEAQALVAKTTEVKVETETAKPRRMSSSSDSKWRRGSNESSPTHSRRGSADLSSKPKVCRGSNEPTTIKRSSSDEGVKTAPKSAATRRKSVNVSGLSAAEKEVLLREVALRDAERIKATRGINGETASEKLTPEPVNLPGPVQEAQRAVADLVEPVEPVVNSSTERVAVTPTGEKTLPIDPIPEYEEEEALAEENSRGKISRAETTDSVQIVGDVHA